MKGLLRSRNGIRNGGSFASPRNWVWVLPLVALLAVAAGAGQSLALQRHPLTPVESGDQSSHGSQQPPAADHATPEAKPSGIAPTTPPVQGGANAPAPHAASQPPAPGHEAPLAVPAHPPAPAEAEGHGEHGPALPQISPIPGVTFVETMINLMEHELYERTLGWRPNDLLVGRFTDNLNNYQLGVLEAIRFTTLRLKDSLTRMGDADAYDPDLEQALNLFMNRATLFWFPSAENSYGEAVAHLKNFLQKLETGKRSFYYRKDNLVFLLSTYKDLMGNVNRSLITSNVSWFDADDNFYYAKGVAHVYYEILRVVRVGFQSQLTSTMNALDIMDEIIHELHRAEELDPLLILDSGPNSFLANHRANLNAPLSEVAHLLVILSML